MGRIGCSELQFAQKFENLAQTPPMGWNSWNGFGCNVDEKLIRETADAMVANGMKDAGYQYVVIDDCWHGSAKRAGPYSARPKRFPSGMKALGDYIHSKGLKFGIYSDVGRKPAAGIRAAAATNIRMRHVRFVGRRLSEIRLVQQRKHQRCRCIHDDAGRSLCRGSPDRFQHLRMGR